MEDDIILGHIMKRLYDRIAIVREEADYLPESDFEDGFLRASKKELEFLEKLISDLEIHG